MKFSRATSLAVIFALLFVLGCQKEPSGPYEASVSLGTVLPGTVTLDFKTNVVVEMTTRDEKGRVLGGDVGSYKVNGDKVIVKRKYALYAIKHYCDFRLAKKSIKRKIAVTANIATIQDIASCGRLTG
jgi:hypothetical protein